MLLVGHLLNANIACDSYPTFYIGHSAVGVGSFYLLWLTCDVNANILMMECAAA